MFLSGESPDTTSEADARRRSDRTPRLGEVGGFCVWGPGRDRASNSKPTGKRLGRPVTLPEEVRHRIATEHAEVRSLRASPEDSTTTAWPQHKAGKSWSAATVKAVFTSVDPDLDRVAV